MKNLTHYLFFFLAITLLSNCKKEKDKKEDSNLTAFNLVFLENGETDVVLKPQLLWEPSTSNTGPVTYTLVMDRKQDLENAGETEPSTIIKEGIALTYFELENNLILGTEYLWHVIAKDEDGNTTKSSSTFSFKTTIDISANNPPGAFNLLLPIDGFLDAPVYPTLTWEASKDPDGHKVTYDLYFGLKPIPKQMIKRQLSTTSYKISTELEYGTTYYWYVDAKDSKGAKTTAITYFTFKTIKDPAGSPIKVKKITSNTFPQTSGRIGHQVVEMNNKIWLVGGLYVGDVGSGKLNDVWNTPDGTNWTLIKAHDLDETKSFTGSDEHQVVAFNNNLWCFVGARNTIKKSSDGVTWTSVKVSGNVIDGTHWKGKHGHQAIVHNGKMWVIGGTNGGTSTNDVWSSPNGEDWTKVSGNTPNSFPKRIGHSSFSFKNKIWVVGGLDTSGSVKSDVWSSPDGVKWTKELEKAPFTERQELDCAIFNDHIFMVGGLSEKDAWYSPDGVNWEEVTGFPDDYRGRNEHQIITFDDAVWIYFGKEQASPLNDTWIIEW